MSSLIVKVHEVEQVKAHPNADTLDIIIVGGWQCIVRKDSINTKDRVVFAPPDSVIPQELAAKLGVESFLSSKGVVKSIRLRGEYSFGLIFFPEDWMNPGDDVSEYYGITKWEPPIPVNGGGSMEVQHSLFHEFTSIENYRNYPDVIRDNELVIISEKIHGTNDRSALIDKTYMAGSHRHRRREKDNDKISRYWFPLMHDNVLEMLSYLSGDDDKAVIAFGEVYGPSIQKGLDYGVKQVNGLTLAYAMFDISVNGKYIDFEDFEAVTSKFEVNTVPILYKGPFSFEIMHRLANEPSKVEGANCIKEGVIVKPLIERTNPSLGRVTLKYFSDEYMVRKSGGKIQDFTDS